MIEIPFIFSIVKISMDFLASRVVLFSSVGLKFQKKLPAGLQTVYHTEYIIKNLQLLL